MVEAIPTAAYYEIARVTDVAVDPDGERVAFVAAEADPGEDETVSSLFVVPTDGSDDPHRLTRASEAGSPKWSPDGSKLGFLAARETDSALRVGRREDEEESTEDGDDGESAGAPESGDGDDEDEPKPQLWVFDLACGGDARQITDREEGVANFDWAPDGDRVVVGARDPTDDQREYLERRREGGPVETERLQHKFDGTGWLDTVRSYLFVVDLETREATRLDDAHDNGATLMGWPAPAWGVGGRIAFASNRTDWPDDNYVLDVYTIRPDGSDLRRVTDGELMAGDLAWSPDGERLAFTGRVPDNWHRPTEVFVADGDGGYRSVSAALDRTVGWSGAPCWLDDRTLVGLFADGGWTRLVRLHADGEPERVFGRQDRLESLGNLDAGGDTLAFVVGRPADGADVHAMAVSDLDAGGAGGVGGTGGTGGPEGTRGTGDAVGGGAGREGAGSTDSDDPRVRLTALNDDFVETHPMPGCRRITYESDDGTEVEAIVYHPADIDPDDPDPRPLVLNIHGGPMSYDEPGFRFQDAVFTSRGYVVCKVNYRGSTSYGRDFCEQLRGAWGTLDVEDLLAGVDHLVDAGWADPDRLFPTGFSQGGVNTAYLVTRDDRWAAAAAEHGVYDLRSDFGTADAQNWYEADYGLPWENPEGYDAHSSITDVGGVETPLLVTAGGQDWRCPPSQSEQLYVSVRKQDVPARLVVYEDEHHNVGDPDRAIHRLDELTGWFERFDPARSCDEG